MFTQHKRKHAPHNKNCFGCGSARKFESYSAMFIHLEAGNCTTTKDEMDTLAARCYQWKRYIRPDCRSWLLSIDHEPVTKAIWSGNIWNCSACPVLSSKEYAEEHIRENDTFYAFQCLEKECGEEFRLLSALLQHVESDRCDAQIVTGGPLAKMMHFIHWNISKESRRAVRKKNRGILV